MSLRFLLGTHLVQMCAITYEELGTFYDLIDGLPP